MLIHPPPSFRSSFDLSALFSAKTNLFLGNDRSGFTLAAGLNISGGGLGDLVRLLCLGSTSLVSSLFAL
jgi:hypothetical protein